MCNATRFNSTTNCSLDCQNDREVNHTDDNLKVGFIAGL